MTDFVYQVQPGPFWDWKVAVDLFLGGAGVGALIFAVLLDTFYRGRFPRICRTAAWLSPVLIVVGLLFLLAKMGRPLHLFLAYTNFNPSAPLWWGGVFQPLLVIGGIVYAWRWRKETPDDSFRRGLGWVLLPLALVVGAYHGLLLAIMPSRPLWNSGPTVVSALLGFAATGIAAVMLVHLIRMKMQGRLVEGEHLNQFLAGMRTVRDTLVIVLVLQLGTFFLWYLSLKYGSLQDRQALAAANEAYRTVFWSLGIGVGLVLPLVVGGLATLRRNDSSSSRSQIAVITVTSVMILVGGFFFRWALLMGGQVELPVQGF